MTRNIRFIFAFLSMLIVLYSCKVSNTEMIGNYKLGSFKKSELTIDSNNHFKYLSDNYSLAVKNDYFFYTEGIWVRAGGDTLLLNSAMDSTHFTDFKMNLTKRDSNTSKFTFLNTQGDTIVIMDVFRNSKIAFYRSHGPFLTSWEGEARKLDTLKFTFTWGYRPIEIYIDSDASKEYCVTLFRNIKPNYFRNSAFKIRKNKLIEISSKEKYQKTLKNGM